MSETTSARAFDRRLYAAVAILFPLIVLAGFARTYYLRGFFDVPPLPSMVVHVHGLVMTAWIALFGAQVWLIASKRVRVHQRLGYAGIALAAIIMTTGFVTAVRAAKYGAALPPPAPPLEFLAVPLFDLLMFAIFFGGAVYYRRRPAAHKRLMLLTVINFLPPAIARIPVTSLQAAGPLWFFGLPTLLVLSCLWLDARKNGLHRLFAAGALLLVTSYVVRLAIMGTDAWMRVALWLTAFV